MGDVCRGRDAALNRHVAIKVLPEAVAGDADRLARFQREAEVLAALNHPNVAHVYGLGLDVNAMTVWRAVQRVGEAVGFSAVRSRVHNPGAPSARSTTRRSGRCSRMTAASASNRSHNSPGSKR